jgi:hypothetical protein
MRSRQEVDRVLALAAEGLNHCEIGRQTGIPRATVRDWINGKAPRGRRSEPPAWPADPSAAGPPEE